MKYCAVICEYNPFHNGHKYQLGQIREQSGCDGILCVMSGNFTQRGDAAVFDKYERAKHAVEGGADVVLELPAAFAVSSAEYFAKGAAHILSSLPCVTRLAFGCESGTKEDFLRTAEQAGMRIVLTPVPEPPVWIGDFCLEEPRCRAALTAFFRA